MPELPEVQTTVNGLKQTVIGKTITDLWSDLPISHHTKIDEIKNKNFWKKFKTKTIGRKIVSASRRGKNILINLDSGETLLIHMKMTGHLLFGRYTQHTRSSRESEEKIIWTGDTKSLQDPFNRFIHLVFCFSDGTHLVLCDARKFAKVSLIQNNETEKKHLGNLGIDALEPKPTLSQFVQQIMKRKNSQIKIALLDQSLITGIGNIYSDEMLWLAKILPTKIVQTISEKEWKKLYASMFPLLQKGINFGGDSTSDYRNIFGDAGSFHHTHAVYRRTGKKCLEKNCGGTIERLVIGGRSAHFCRECQK